MKSLHVAAILFFSGIIGLTSCSKKNDDVMPAPTQATPTTPTSTTTSTTTPTTTTTTSSTAALTSTGFVAKIDGKDYIPDFVYSKAVMPGNDGYYGIYGLDSRTGDVVFIGLPYAALVGTHKLSYVNYGGFSLGNGTDSYSTRVEPGEGTVTITKVTTTNVEGTFSFVAYNDKGTVKRTITDGKFNVPFK
ncbi:hypothetical protein IC229_04480 [Spirosoma sp. BT702]|uniref:Lipoprotein n=1 Tax=Spirosoma profusum TaxID=2771354 RepID=A0A926XTZ2_9BACT|nr:DUF6252 family protein [Spirosoma profusum]MBD2699879.1 hypothetical protein [Spirosoma profusum]